MEYVIFPGDTVYVSSRSSHSISPVNELRDLKEKHFHPEKEPQVEWRKLNMSNSNNPIINLYWSRLVSVGPNSVYRRECPFCKDGIFLVGRDRKTFALEELDRCISCGQIVHYIDIEEMRRRESS